MALTEKATAALSPTGALHSKGGLLAENVTVKYDSSPGLYIILMLPLPFACPFFSPPQINDEKSSHLWLSTPNKSPARRARRGERVAKMQLTLWFGFAPTLEAGDVPRRKRREPSASRSPSRPYEAWSGLQSNYQRRERDIQRWSETDRGREKERQRSV